MATNDRPNTPHFVAAEMPELLRVPDVMDRYGFRDRRAARAIMDRAGAFRVGGHVYVHVADLVALEQREKVERLTRAPARPIATSRPQKRRESVPDLDQLPTFWWRNASPGA